MQELNHAHRVATSRGADVVILTKAIQVLMGQCEARVRTFVSVTGDARDGEFDAMTLEIEGLFRLVSDLGQVASQSAESARAGVASALAVLPEPLAGDTDVLCFWVECQRSLVTLGALQSTVDHIRQEAAHGIETLRGHARQRATSVDAIATFNALLDRMRQAPSDR